MKSFLAGFSAALPNEGHITIVSALLKRGDKIRELLSFVDLLKGPLQRKMAMTDPVRVEMFLDSGAYSAWSRGAVIDIDEYARYVLDRPGVFQVVANLDVIPGAWGVVPTQAQIDESASRGWENYYYLEKKLAPAGVTPMHIFHQGEDFKWLRKLMDEAEYFGVSPGNDRTTKQKIEWLDQVFQVLTDAQGRPLRKTHGFGVTALEILFRFPWASCDSTSWVLTGRFGAVFVPLGDKVHKVTFSDRSPRVADAGQHFTTFTTPEQRAILGYIEQKGFTPDQLAIDYIARDSLNIEFFVDLEKNWVPQPFKRGEVQPTFGF